MSITVLPTEILLDIFRNVSGIDIGRCRRVCTRWRDIVDGLSKEHWERYCTKHQHYVADAKTKSKLDWKQFYHSLCLWSKIDSAKLRGYKLFAKAQYFQVLKEGVVAVCENHAGNMTDLWGYSDTIAYYELETLSTLKKVHVGFPFTSYKENDLLICLVHRTGMFCIIVKETMEKFYLGELPLCDNGQPVDYSLIAGEVYYQGRTDHLRVARLVKREIGLVIESEIICDFQESLLAVNKTTDGKLYILTDEVSKGSIYEYSDTVFSLATTIDMDHNNCIIYDLGDYGFDWTEPSILHWLFRTFDVQTLRITKLKISSLCGFGTTILLGTYRRLISIYPNVYSADGKLNLFNTSPLMSINMNDICLAGSPFKEIQMLDAVEIENGHQVIVLTDDQLFVLEFHHGEEKRGAKRQKFEIKTSPSMLKRKKKRYDEPSTSRSSQAGESSAMLCDSTSSKKPDGQQSGSAENSSKNGEFKTKKNSAGLQDANSVATRSKKKKPSGQRKSKQQMSVLATKLKKTTVTNNNTVNSE